MLRAQCQCQCISRADTQCAAQTHHWPEGQHVPLPHAPPGTEVREQSEGEGLGVGVTDPPLMTMSAQLHTSQGRAGGRTASVCSTHCSKLAQTVVALGSNLHICYYHPPPPTHTHIPTPTHIPGVISDSPFDAGAASMAAMNLLARGAGKPLALLRVEGVQCTAEALS